MLIAISEMLVKNPSLTGDAAVAQIRSGVGESGFLRVDLLHMFNLVVRLGHRNVKNMAEFHFELIDPSVLKMKPSDMACHSRHRRN